MYLIFNICRYFFIKQYYTTKKTICPRFTIIILIFFGIIVAKSASLRIRLRFIRPFALLRPFYHLQRALFLPKK